MIGAGGRIRHHASWCLFLVLVLAACSSGSGGAERSSGTDTTGAVDGGDRPPATVPGPLPVTLTERVETHGTLRLGFGGTVALDPVGASPASAADMILTDLLYDTLTVLDEDGRPQPGLATFTYLGGDEDGDVDDALDDDGEDEAAPDCEDEDCPTFVWRFELNDGVTFGDGTTITADDVRQSLERVQQRGPSSVAGIRLAGIESITTIGSTTVDIAMSEPSMVLPEILSSPLYGITDGATVAAYTGGPVRPIPSGDYAVEAQAETELVLARRSGSGPERIYVDVFPTEDDALDAFTAGDIDWAPVPVDRFEEAISAAGSAGLVPYMGGMYLAIDPGLAPLDDRAVRRAIAVSVDRTSLVDEVYGPAAQPMLGAIPAGVPGAAVDECRGPCVTDRAHARQVAERVFPDGQDRPLRVLVDDTPTMKALGNVVGEQIAASGFVVEVSSEDAVTYEQLIAAGQQQLFVYGWLGVARTPADYLVPLFQSTSPDNVIGYVNEEVDAKIAQAESSPDPAVRAQLWAEIESIVLEDAVVVPLVQFRTASVIAPRVSGLVIRADGTLDLSDLTLADP